MTNATWKPIGIVAAVILTALTACTVGQPIPIPEPESQLGSKPGLFTGETGEWVIYRR
jgi:hypothetical protein